MKDKAKILVGYDGSDCAESMLDDLQRAGLPPEAEVCVMSVAEVWLPPPATIGVQSVEGESAITLPAHLNHVYARAAENINEVQSLADRAAKRLRTNFPGWTVLPEASYGSPAWELIAKADHWKPDLIVVGSHGRTGIGRWLLGSVSQRVLNEARCSVRIARGRVEEADSPNRLLIGVDGSIMSQHVVKAIASRFWPTHSEARVVLVNQLAVPAFVGQLIPAISEDVEENKQRREWQERALAESASILRHKNLKVSTHVLEGDPKQVLVEVAEAWHADSIFVGSIGFSNRVERFVLGSVSAAVAARAHCSVEVVRPSKLDGGNHHHE